MKKIFFSILFVLTLCSLSQAREVVSVGVYGGAPYYAEPAPYYAATAYPGWYSTPVSVIYINGYPHRMHMWQGQWYDEAWVTRGSPYYSTAVYYDRGWDHHRRW